MTSTSGTSGKPRRHHRLKPLTVRARSLTERADPTTRLAQRLVLPSLPPALVIGVYRTRHADRLAALLTATALPARLWGLDGRAETLASLTVGVGPGTRFELLNRVVAGAPPADDAWLVVLDDDLEIARGDIPLALRLATHFGVDLAQPAHAADSDMSYPFVRARWGSLLRRTTYVEQGPCLLISPRARGLMTPFPENLGMGWGVEASWSLLARRQLSLGIIDAVTIRHLSSPGAAYDSEEQWGQAVRLFADAGFGTPAAAQVGLTTVRVWNRPQR